jgi:hypothetical protein
MTVGQLDNWTVERAKERTDDQARELERTNGRTDDQQM